ncbi:Plasma membrane ATPase-like protein [Hapsidospora chrysogenum ATCC 11550]|uniref:Plasma membrane ATPase n=1 Tax=Hapsidospora chrysogenum (strain ATCC 11550 / CBS 779.69 / DSM 880 / IAM 14645 / JCM 23072 / IMI 49137) TaxID=857340 RepID=A0A086T3H0_HAPC1|nr:Plasma membrane ATPase-like protein [Hapsidospora chrysogenum ATCC 11550]
MFSRLHRRQPKDAEAGGNLGESSSSGNREGDNLGEYPALDRYISVYRDDTPLSGEETHEKRKTPWWKFWKFQDDEAVPHKPIPPGAGIPEDWLSTDISAGIRSSDVEERRKRTGYNELMAEKENPFVKFLSYFRGPILYVMELAALLALGLSDWIDFGVIMGILMLNAFVGFYQEKQAADVVASLKGDIAMRCNVVRDGQKVNILARELVLGDIVIIQEGDTVPADARLICDYDRPEDFDVYKRLLAEDKLGELVELENEDEDEGEDEGEENNEKANGADADGAGVANLRRGSVYFMMQQRNRPLIAVDQSAITGESLAVDKYMGDTVYYTTGCKRGKAYAVVISSARQSFVGRTANLVEGAKDQGHFKAVMDSIGTALLILVMFWILIAWIGGFFRHIGVTGPGSRNLLHYALVLAIIGVPVGLPVVTTTTLAVGAAYLAKQKAIVQKLTAIESLAGVDILCSDKTGTLTANKLSMREPFVSEGQDVNWMMAVAALASSHNIQSLDPIDKVTILALKRYPLAREILQRGWSTVKFTPFDPVSKRITAVCRLGDDTYVCAKGAPRAILRLTDCEESLASVYRDRAQEFARRGFRSLGVAVKKNDEPWVLLGLLSMFDPPREDTAQTIIEASQLGVPVKMLTGDALAIAKETCKMLALGTKVYNSEKLIHGGLTGSVQHDLVERADGFAEVFPEHKYTVVEMLQQRGHLTAMTGDGVNDAPSLKKADCGIAVQGASEAAQAAADIVFLAPGLSTIVLAIKTSRQIFHRMKSYVQYRIALCLHLEIYLTLSMIIINETIRTDLIVFIALFADLATVAVAYDNAYWDPRPVEWQLPKIWVVSVILGVLLAIATWIIRGTMFLPNGGIIRNFGSVQEVLFLQIALTENWLIFVTRGGRTWPSWQLVGAILGVDIIATLFCLFGWLSGTAGAAETPTSTFKNRFDGWTDIVTVVLVWLYSFGVTVFIAIIYLILNKVSWLNDLGRKDRSKKDTIVEDILAQLQKLAIEHELDAKTGRNRYILTEKASEEEEEL